MALHGERLDRLAALLRQRNLLEALAILEAAPRRLPRGGLLAGGRHRQRPRLGGGVLAGRQPHDPAALATAADAVVAGGAAFARLARLARGRLRGAGDAGVGLPPALDKRHERVGAGDGDARADGEEGLALRGLHLADLHHEVVGQHRRRRHAQPGGLRLAPLQDRAVERLVRLRPVGLPPRAPIVEGARPIQDRAGHGRLLRPRLELRLGHHGHVNACRAQLLQRLADLVAGLRRLFNLDLVVASHRVGHGQHQRRHRHARQVVELLLAARRQLVEVVRRVGALSGLPAQQTTRDEDGKKVLERRPRPPLPERRPQRAERRRGHGLLHLRDDAIGLHRREEQPRLRGEVALHVARELLAAHAAVASAARREGRALPHEAQQRDPAARA
mmetsp:Transcript_30483/g.86997  ORF Transcript_30483/g.86997 Transcript_30483/m.86997 type:complete len:389 (-) Transcript_30483:1299-2465(-)